MKSERDTNSSQQTKQKDSTRSFTSAERDRVHQLFQLLIDIDKSISEKDEKQRNNRDTDNASEA